MSQGFPDSYVFLRIFHIFIRLKFHVVNLSLPFFHGGSLEITPAVLLMLNNFINLYLILSDTFDLKLKYDVIPRSRYNFINSTLDLMYKG